MLVAGLRSIGVFGTGRRLGSLRTRSGWRAILAARRHPPRERRVAPGRVDVSHRRRVPAEEQRPADGVRGHAAPRRRHALSEHARRPRHRARSGDRPATVGIRCQGAPRREATAISRAAACPCGSAAANAASSSRPSTRASSHSNAATGKPIPGFGEQGTVDLRKGLRIAPTGFADYQVTSPPASSATPLSWARPSRTARRRPHPSGEVRGFDAITGKLQWTWDPVPQDPAAVGADYVEEQQRRPARAAPMPGR